MKYNDRFNKLLENKYHMNSKLDETMSKLGFTNHKNYMHRTNTLKLAIICTTAAVISGLGFGVGGYFIGLNNASNNASQYNDSEYIQEAIDFISKECTVIYKSPLIKYTLNTEYYINIYKGQKIIGNELSNLFYYQIIGNMHNNSKVILSFNNSVTTKTIEINDSNSLGKINDDTFTITTYLDISVNIDDTTVLKTNFEIF